VKWLTPVLYTKLCVFQTSSVHMFSELIIEISLLTRRKLTVSYTDNNISEIIFCDSRRNPPNSNLMAFSPIKDWFSLLFRDRRLEKNWTNVGDIIQNTTYSLPPTVHVPQLENLCCRPVHRYHLTRIPTNVVGNKLLYRIRISLM